MALPLREREPRMRPACRVCRAGDMALGIDGRAIVRGPKEPGLKGTRGLAPLIFEG